MQVATKYAKLLFDQASKAKAMDKTLEELSLMHDAIFSKPDIAKALTSPVEKDKIEELLVKVVLRFKISDLVSNFMRLVVRLKRLKLLPDMVSEYQRLMDSIDGRKIVGLVSAREMDKKDIAAVDKLLLSQFGDNIVVKYSVDPTIIGGIIASCNSLTIDASVRGAMDRICCPQS